MDQLEPVNVQLDSQGRIVWMFSAARRTLTTELRVLNFLLGFHASAMKDSAVQIVIYAQVLFLIYLII